MVNRFYNCSPGASEGPLFRQGEPLIGTEIQDCVWSEFHGLAAAANYSENITH